MAAYHHLLLLVLVYSTNFVYEPVNGFSVRLIHRDSPLSPYYNKSATIFERLERATKRSFHRVKYLSQQEDDVTSMVLGTGGEYFMEFFIGTPPYFILATIDTGSDLTWTQCEPCVGCSEQLNDPFEPYDSSTYEKVPCTTDNDCRIHDYCVGRPNCIEDQSRCDTNNNCRFRITYQDGNSSSGEIARDTFTFNTTDKGIISFPRIKFGCSHSNDALESNIQSGLAGLGGGPSSMISQLGSMLDAKQFSYCLVPFDGSYNIHTSQLNFGRHADVIGEDVVSTPILTKGSTTFYFLTLKGVSVGDSHMVHAQMGVGNIMIDSGTMLTHLPLDVYEKLKSKIKNAIDYEPLNHEVRPYDLCYEDDLDDMEIPNITFNFIGGDIILQPFNTFVPNFEHEGVNLRCLTIVPIEDESDPAVFGTFAQMNFLIMYDLENKKVVFKPTDCTRESEYI